MAYPKTLKRLALAFAFAVAFSVAATAAHGQQRLKTMRNYERYELMTREATNAVKLGSLSVTWKDGGHAFEFTQDGKRYRYDIESRQRSAAGTGTNTPASERGGRRQRLEAPARGRQFTSVMSPDAKHKAFYKDRNVWLSDTNGSNSVAITTDGSDKTRVKFGSASWVYGEELYQSTAMWWSSNSQKLAFYRFDESKVPDYFLTLRETRIQNTLYTEPYAKAGGTNPLVDILIYDIESKQSVAVDVRSGQPFTDEAVGHYVYAVSWSADNRELIFHRTDRRQKIMELCAADASTGKCRVIIREEWQPSWTENLPTFRFLKDGRRFIWSSERTGWKNFYLYNLDGQLLAPLTRHKFEASSIAHVDEDRGLIYYLARSGDNPMKSQLHRVSLDGSGDVRLTDPAFHHTVDMAPDGRHFVDVAQTHNTPPVTRLFTGDGKVLDELATSDMSRFKRLGMHTVELLTFKAADGKTDLYGMLHKPSSFNRWTKYPLLVSVYAGPETTGARETFQMPSPSTELGFLVASFDSRSASGRGKRFLDSVYTNFGQVEIDDQAAGVRSLHNRWYVAEKRVGIYGTSYGGTASAMCLFRYPDVFQAACASSGVTDWRNYDTIYTERYMGLLAENRRAYTAGSVLTYATNLTGRLMIFYGTADDNVHPSNSLQLIDALQKAKKSFDVQIGPDAGHAGLNRDRMLEFFIDTLRR